MGTASKVTARNPVRNAGELILRSLVYHAPMNLAVMMGSALTTAIIVGALVVGDSVRGSLADLTLDRLGKIDLLLISDRFFGRELVSQVESLPSLDNQPSVASAEGLCILSQTTIERRAGGRARGVLLVGRDIDWQGELPIELKFTGRLESDQILINRQLAEELGAKVGDELILRLPESDQVPAESPLGRKNGLPRSRTGLIVAAILPNQGWGALQLTPSQQTPRNAYVSPTLIQDVLEAGDRINALSVKSTSADRTTDTALVERLQNALRPSAEDAGLEVDVVRSEFGPEQEIAWQYAQIATDRMIFANSVRTGVLGDLQEQLRGQWAFTYLATSISKVNRSAQKSGDHSAPESAPADGNLDGRVIPYSTVTAVDPHPVLGPYVRADGTRLEELGDGELVLNAWAAEQLEAEPGDTIRLTYFAPETTHGRTEERSADFQLAAILPLREPAEPYRRRRPAHFDEPPYWTNDPDLTPAVEGVTDQDSIDRWDPPFPFDQRRVQPPDDEYWEDYRATPKAFITLATGRRLWDSRFGAMTSLRIPLSGNIDTALIRERIAQGLSDHPQAAGLEFRAVKQAGLAASSGTTPFEGLFIGFSMFLVSSALMLTAILFQLWTVLRQREFGTLMALGWTARKTRELIWLESLVLAALGGLVGLIGGIAYGSAMLAGLRTWWIAAVVTPFMSLHITPRALLLGFGGSLFVNLAVVFWSAGRLARRSPLGLLRLAGDDESVASSMDRHKPQQRGRYRWLFRAIPGLALLLALVLCFGGVGLSGEAQAGTFFAAGGCVLGGLLTAIRNWLKRPTDGLPASDLARRMSLWGLATTAARRNATRTLLAIGLMSAASFLIVAIAAFRLSPSEAGTGGFAIIAESDRPLFADLNDPDERVGWITSPAGDNSREAIPETVSALWKDCFIASFRVRPGDDASCRNLYQSAQPRLLGVTPGMAQYFDSEKTDSTDQPLSGESPATLVTNFAWAAAVVKDNPWNGLFETDRATSPEIIPVILDKNTALYSLHLSGRLGEEFTIDYDRPLRFKIMGLLANTILQGSLLVAENDLVREFPDVEGYRMFLVATPPDRASQVAAALENQFHDEGLDTRDSVKELESLMAVQNTYLSTFQSLGLLGLLLGSVGLAIVQVRNVMERRGELGLLRAIGFPPARLQLLLVAENGVLVLLGLAVGVIAALVTTLPHVLFAGARLPLTTLAVMVASVAAVGLGSSLLAARVAARDSVLNALRQSR